MSKIERPLTEQELKKFNAIQDQPWGIRDSVWYGFEIVAINSGEVLATTHDVLLARAITASHQDKLNLLMMNADCVDKNKNLQSIIRNYLDREQSGGRR